jgi:hypothetical protein
MLHVAKFFDGDFQILDDGAQCFAFQFAFVHRDYYAGPIAVSHIYCMTAALAPKPNRSATRTKSFAVAVGSFRVTPESQSA